MQGDFLKRGIQSTVPTIFKKFKNQSLMNHCFPFNTEGGEYEK